MIEQALIDIKNNIRPFSPHSKVWVYLSDTNFEANHSDIQNALEHFISKWASHGKPIKAYASTLGYRFILIFADEHSEVSGCATDSSVNFIKQLGDAQGLNFFNRNIVAYLDTNEVKTTTIEKLSDLPTTTQVFNPFFKDIQDWTDNFVQPISISKWKRFANQN